LNARTSLTTSLGLLEQTHKVSSYMFANAQFHHLSRTLQSKTSFEIQILHNLQDNVKFYNFTNPPSKQQKVESNEMGNQ
jgi:hypothetical protein